MARGITLISQYSLYISSHLSCSQGQGVPPPLPLRRGEDASMAGNTGAWVAAVRGIAEGQPGPSETDPQLPCHVFHETTYRISSLSQKKQLNLQPAVKKSKVSF